MEPPPVVGGSPEQLANRRQQLRQQTVEQHRLLRRLADEQSQIEAELGVLERDEQALLGEACLLYTSPSPRDATLSRMPSSA